MNSFASATEFSKLPTTTVSGNFPNSKVYNVDMFYDSYEADFGDGFYPMTKSSEPCTTKTTIGFQLLRLPTGTPSTNVYGVKSLTSDFVYGSLQTTEFSRSPPPSCAVSTARSKLITETDLNVYWKQTNNAVIKGLDGNEGILLFSQLNNQIRVDNTFVTVKGIVNTHDKLIYPKNT
jgi:hypothetical protein